MSQPEHPAPQEQIVVAPLPPRHDEAQPAPARESGIGEALDRFLAIQRPVVLAQIRRLRRRYPEATPAELARKIELQYLNTITATGGSAGAVAVVPGIGTAASLAVTGVETLGFLEMTALYGQAIAEIHGLQVSDPLRAQTLIQSLLLGDSAQSLVRQFAGQALGKGVGKQVFWGEIVTRSLPRAAVGELAGRIQSQFLRRFAGQTAAGGIGRLVPFGIGAVIGGAGNRILGRAVVHAARSAFGPPPVAFPLDLHPDVKVRGEDETAAVERGRPFLFFRLPRGASMAALERGHHDDRKRGKRR